MLALVFAKIPFAPTEIIVFLADFLQYGLTVDEEMNPKDRLVIAPGNFEVKEILVQVEFWRSRRAKPTVMTVKTCRKPGTYEIPASMLGIGHRAFSKGLALQSPPQGRPITFKIKKNFFRRIRIRARVNGFDQQGFAGNHFRSRIVPLLRIPNLHRRGIGAHGKGISIHPSWERRLGEERSPPVVGGKRLALDGRFQVNLLGE